MSSFCKCKSCSHFFRKNISIYAIFNDQSFNDTLNNNIVHFEQLGPDFHFLCALFPNKDTDVLNKDTGVLNKDTGAEALAIVLK